MHTSFWNTPVSLEVVYGTFTGIIILFVLFVKLGDRKSPPKGH
jgi:hypothetical protein